jgi:hypothetical protein
VRGELGNIAGQGVAQDVEGALDGGLGQDISNAL